MAAFAHNTELKLVIFGAGLGLALLLPEMRAASTAADYAYGATAVVATLLATLGVLFALVLALNLETPVLRWAATALCLAGAVALGLASAALALHVGNAGGRLAALALAVAPLAISLLAIGAFLRDARALGAAARIVDRIDHLAARPGDSADERLAKALLLFLAVFVIGAGAVAAWAFRARGADAVADLCAGGALLALGGGLYFVLTGSRRPLQPLLLVVLLVLPLVAQSLLGGFAASGGFAMWAMLAPIGALVLQGPRAAILWFGAFVLGALGGALEEGAGAPLWFAEDLLLLACMVFILLRHFVAERARAQAALEREQARSESLLLNILPGPIAERLKLDPRSIADDFAEVTVLFADIVGFTQLSARLPPAELVAMLNELFSRFDALATKHGVEKIKTIGDAYMACAGLPEPRADHARVAAELALDMQDALAAYCRERGIDLRIRIGLNSGPVVAGVIGLKKFIYDLWGDTVNTASRMESHGVAGEVQVTAATRALLGDAFAFEDRGELEVKGKGRVRAALLRRKVGAGG